MRNDKFRGTDTPPEFMHSAEPPVASQVELDEEQLEAIVEAVQGSSQDVSGDLEEVRAGPTAAGTLRVSRLD